jgi:hypothetical protein
MRLSRIPWRMRFQVASVSIMLSMVTVQAPKKILLGKSLRIAISAHTFVALR